MCISGDLSQVVKGSSENAAKLQAVFTAGKVALSFCVVRYTTRIMINVIIHHLYCYHHQYHIPTMNFSFLKPKLTTPQFCGVVGVC